MTQGPRTPKSNSDEDGVYGSWLPRDIPYDAAFEDSVLQVLSKSPSNAKPIRLIPTDSTEQPRAGVSVRLEDIDMSSLPQISLSDLPLPLSDPRRKYESPIPGIFLTHPYGFLEGGPGISPDDDEFARHFVSDNRIRDADSLSEVVQQQIKENVQLARDRMRAREEAVEHNRRIEREIATLTDQMDLETKVLNKAREKAKERRERKEAKGNK